MRRRRPWIVWLAAALLFAAGFALRHSLYVWLLRLHGIRAH